MTSTYPSSPSASTRIRLADPAAAAQAGASVVGDGFSYAEIPPSFHLGADSTKDAALAEATGSGLDKLIARYREQSGPIASK